MRVRPNQGKQFAGVQADTMDAPVFSEAFLYGVAFNECYLTKGDARFIDTIGEEYETLIRLLGEETVNQLLGLEPPCTITFHVAYPSQDIKTEARLVTPRKEARDG